jgi:hypothetical protein
MKQARDSDLTGRLQSRDDTCCSCILKVRICLKVVLRFGEVQTVFCETHEASHISIINLFLFRNKSFFILFTLSSFPFRPSLILIFLPFLPVFVH